MEIHAQSTSTVTQSTILCEVFLGCYPQHAEHVSLPPRLARHKMTYFFLCWNQPNCSCLCFIHRSAHVVLHGIAQLSSEWLLVEVSWKHVVCRTVRTRLKGDIRYFFSRYDRKQRAVFIWSSINNLRSVVSNLGLLCSLIYCNSYTSLCATCYFSLEKVTKSKIVLTLSNIQTMWEWIGVLKIVG